MAKIKIDPITTSDLSEYVKSDSDFSFELQTLQICLQHGFQCEHGGTYTDPVTKKPRQFDLRATWRGVLPSPMIYIAAECKNLKANSPLLVYSVPRRREESFHDILCSHPTKGNVNVQVGSSNSIYEVGKPTGKTCDQIARSADNQFVAGDKQVYEKWAQAVNSGYDLIENACFGSTGSPMCSFIMPMLVVPDNMLWSVEFDEVGKLTQEPRMVDRCSYFINKTYITPVDSRGYAVPYRMSHIEFVTTRGLTGFIEYLKNDNTLFRMFPQNKISENLRSR